MSRSTVVFCICCIFISLGIFALGIWTMTSHLFGVALVIVGLALLKLLLAPFLDNLEVWAGPDHLDETEILEEWYNGDREKAIREIKRQTQN